ncbi:MAG: PilZ domain-containing protein [Bradymonadales bacterium]|nr:MAG: PilZ domain-containing protein [Bradymonadales bacterium]
MEPRRKYPRYEAKELPELQLRTLAGPIGEKLLNVSRGGCGFWAPFEDFQLRVGQGLRLQLKLDSKGSEFEIRGELLYVHPCPMESQIGRLYGIRFEAESKELNDYIEAHEAEKSRDKKTQQQRS